MEKVESPNSELKKRISELRQILEKKKRKLETSLRHSRDKEKSSGDGESAFKRVRFSEPASLRSPVLASQNLFDDDDSDEAFAAALSESTAQDCDLDASQKATPPHPPPPPPSSSPPSPLPSSVVRFSAPCNSAPRACDLLVIKSCAFLCLLSEHRVELLSGPADASCPLTSWWSREAPVDFKLCRLLMRSEGGTALLLAEVKDNAVHFFCLDFGEGRLLSAYPVCALPVRPVLLLSARPQGPYLVTASAAGASEVVVIAGGSSELRAVHHCHTRFSISSAAVLSDNGAAVVVATKGSASRLVLLNFPEGTPRFLPPQPPAPKCVHLLRQEEHLCFLAGLDSAAIFLSCVSPRTMQYRGLRSIPLSLSPDLHVSFLTEDLLLWTSEGHLETAVLSWDSGVCSRAKFPIAGDPVLSRPRVLCLWDSEAAAVSCFQVQR